MIPNIINSYLYKKVTDKTNIYNSIYALESYIFEKGLLSTQDLIIYNKLSDKYDFKYIDKIIGQCQTKLKSILTNPLVLFDVEVFFKFKKIDNDGKTVFRPLHTADLISQICIVSMLNIIMFEDSLTKKDVTRSRRRLSDIAKLVPANFYGNIPSTNPDEIFINWKVKYKEYSETIINKYYEYKSNNKYTQEVCLDLKDFFPSINPVHIYNLIYNKIEPSFVENVDKECLGVILQKLLYFNIKPFDHQWNEHYYPKIDIRTLRKSRYSLINRGLPQGLPHAYLFSNLCMVEVAKHTKSVFAGESFYYVDDSVIYTNDIEKEAFSRKINELNDLIQTSFKQEYEQNKSQIVSCLDKKKLDFNNLIEYAIEIHNGDKSSINPIGEAYNDLSKLQNLATQISGVASIFSTLDETEDSNLKKKLEILIIAIDKEIKLEEKRNNTDKAKKYKLKLLLRYKKFFLFRLRLLQYTEKAIEAVDFDKFYDKYGFDRNNKQLDKKTFFDCYEEDIFIAEVRLIIQCYEGDNDNLIAFKENICIIEEKLLSEIISPDNRKMNLYIKRDIDGTLEIFTFEDFKYRSLNKFMNAEYRFFPKTTSLNRIEKLEEILQKEIYSLSIIKEHARFIFDLSDEFRRKILNALFSYIFGIGITDSCSLNKYNNRAILYYELRIICYLRNRHFDFDKFILFANTILKESKEDKTVEKVDSKIFEVLHIFIKKVKQPNYVDSLIIVHKLVNGLWKNGSKFLHFYTLHNEEHAIELIQQTLKLTRAIDYFKLKDIDFYLLFLACYLHDISMVVHPNLEDFKTEIATSDNIFTEYILEKTSAKKIDTKALLLKYFKKVFSFFENEIRGKHPKQSALFIIKIRDTYLSFIERTHLQIVADVSEAHGFYAYEVYGRKSKGYTDIYSIKYLMILLRLADLLDMCKDRVSYYILKENIRHMEQISQFHWISHLVTDRCDIRLDYELKSTKTIDSSLEKNAINEIVHIDIYLNTKQFTKVDAPLICKGYLARNTNNGISIEILDEESKPCDNASNCLFSCKWMTKKQDYLFKELVELKKYLKRVNNGIFETQLYVNLICEDKINLDTEFRDIISNYLEKK
ncbi:reverse transcriptase domain-containing protein [Bacteroides reticulotermitis]|uniref:HD domain-containing protein n=1 Tax=Bacteroides reticulotermitis TaxID=1133319 RepID=UPI003A839F0B